MAEKDSPKKHPKQWDIPEEAWEHAQAARDAWRKSFVALFPPEFIEHRRAARKEMLMAARSLIDAAITRIDKE